MIQHVTKSSSDFISSLFLFFRIRLMESELFSFNKQKQRGRLGYVTIPIKESSEIEKTITFYEQTFTNQQVSQQSASLQNPALIAQESHILEVGKKIGSFRLVDMERFVEELTTYSWLGNGSRKKTTTVCYYHKTIRRGKKLSIRPYNLYLHS